MNSNQLILLVVSLLAASVASAAINIGTVPVGNAGNANDTPASGPANGFFNGHHPKSKFRAIIHFIILLALTSFPLQSASAASVLLDNFDSYATASTLASQGGWMLSTDSVNTSTVVVDPTNASNKVASMTASNSGSGTTAFGTIYLGLGTNAIANNTTSTLFFRFYTTASFPNFNVGLTDVAAPTNGNFAINQSQFRVGGGAYLTDPGDQLHTINGSFQLLDSYQQGVWHNVWVVVDNSTNTQSYYASTGSDDAVLLGTPSYSFRTATNNSIQTLQLISDAIYASGEDGGPVLIDDIYISSGVNTTLIPEPSTYAMIFGLAMLGLVVLGRVRGSQKA